MKVETFHNIVHYSSLTVLAGSTLAIAAAPTTLTVTVTAVALGILALQTERACRHAHSAGAEFWGLYWDAFKSEYTLKRAAILSMFFCVGVLACFKLQEIATPPKFAVRTPIQ